MDNITLVSYNFETHTTTVDLDMPFGYVTVDKFSVNDNGKQAWYRVIQYHYAQKVAFAVRVNND